MDEIDQAQQNDEFFRRQALTAHYRARSIFPPGVATTVGVAEAAGLREADRSPAPAIAGGICIDCEEEIEPERLEAVPGAVRCVDCQQRRERRMRHAG